jgi:pyruvate dehydrogenase E1 component alpha subunit
VARARAGDGPTLVEAETYRWKGHSKSDKNLYRTREEIADWRKRDPIIRFEQLAVERGTLDQATVQQIRTDATQAVRDAVTAANGAPDARADDILDSVYAGADR